MKKAKEEDRKKFFNNRMRKAVAIQLILIVVFSVKILYLSPEEKARKIKHPSRQGPSPDPPD